MLQRVVREGGRELNVMTASVYLRCVCGKFIPQRGWIHPTKGPNCLEKQAIKLGEHNM